MGAYDTMQAAKAAAMSGNWEILSWLLQQSPNDQVWQDVCWPCNALDHIFILPEQQALLKLKSLDALLDLADIVRSHHLNACWLAAKTGYISSLQWLQDRWPVCAETSWAAQAAAAFGRLDAMQWLRQDGAAWHWDDMVCYRAAGSGHLDILKWLTSQEPPCPFPGGFAAEQLAKETAEKGHSHVLK